METALCLALVPIFHGCGESSKPDSEETATAESPPTPVDQDATTLEALEDRLREARALDDPDQRALIIEEIAQTLVRYHGAEEPGNAPEPAAATEDHVPDTLRQEFADALAREDRSLRHAALREMAGTLARNGDLSTARNLIDEILRIRDADGGGDAYVLATTFAEFAAHTSPALGIAWTRSLPAALRGAAQQALTQQWTKSDPDGVDSWRRSESDPVARSIIIRAMGNEMRSADASAAAAWAARLAIDPEDGPRHSDVVVEHWARGDMEAAIAWIDTIERDDFQSRAMRTLASSIANLDPNEAGAWLARFPEGEWKTLALTDTATRWGMVDPAAAAQWISALDRPDVAKSTAATVARNWAASDRAAAVAWIRRLAIDEGTRTYALKMLGEE